MRDESHQNFLRDDLEDDPQFGRWEPEDYVSLDDDDEEEEAGQEGKEPAYMSAYQKNMFNLDDIRKTGDDDADDGTSMFGNDPQWQEFIRSIEYDPSAEQGRHDGDGYDDGAQDVQAKRLEPSEQLQSQMDQLFGPDGGAAADK